MSDSTSEGSVPGVPVAVGGSATTCDGMSTRDVLLLAYAAMHHMGDVLNDMNACEPEDEAATDAAFAAVRFALGEPEEGDAERLAEWRARTTAGQSDASPPSASATADPRLLKSEPASGTPSPEEAAREGPGEVERRQVSPGDLGAPVRFEIEHDSGAILRFRGEDAARHVAALNRACRLAEGRMEWPTALPEVIASAPDPRPAGCVCPVERVRREVRACPVHGERE